MASEARKLPAGFVSASPHERAVHWAVSRLVRCSGLTFGEGHQGAEALARNVLAAIAGGADPRVAGQSVLGPYAEYDALARSAGKQLGHVWRAVELGWCDEALRSLVTGMAVTVVVSAPDAVSAHDAVPLQFPGLSTAGTRTTPEQVRPGRWRVRACPEGRFTTEHKDGLATTRWKEGKAV